MKVADVAGAPYDERNEADFRDMSVRIAEALERLEIDLTIPATEESLAGLAGCSRGTLRHRGWPLKRLKEIKQSRKEKKDEEGGDIPPGEVDIVEILSRDKKSLLDQLKKSRGEVALWVEKYRQLEEETKKLRRLITMLQEAKKSLEDKLKKVFPFKKSGRRDGEDDPAAA
jgi:hypothetical protein